MTAHRIEMPERLQRPECSCGWRPDLPWRCCTWDQWDTDARAHLATVCGAHDTYHRDCPGCRRANAARGWATRRANTAAATNRTGELE